MTVAPAASLKERIEQGREAFNRGEFFEAHERWEDAWHQLQGPERDAVQGLIQIAAGLHHLQRGRRRPAARLLRKGLARLSPPLPGLLDDLAVGDLAGDVGRFLARLEAPGAPAALDPGTLRLSPACHRPDPHQE
jgi:hypothetical protein